MNEMAVEPQTEVHPQCQGQSRNHRSQEWVCGYHFSPKEGGAHFRLQKGR